MRIAQVTYSYWPITGGADVYAELLRRTFAGSVDEQWIFQRAVTSVPDYVKCYPAWTTRCKRYEYWACALAARQLRKVLRTFDKVLVHYPAYFGAAAEHPGTICLSHGVDWDDAPGSWRSRLKFTLAKRAFKAAPVYVANDTHFLRWLGLDVAAGTHAFEQVAPGRYYFPNCVDCEVFTPGEPLPEFAGSEFLLVPRNLYRNRGVHLALSAFAQVLKVRPQLKLVVAGAIGQANYAAELFKQVAEEGLAGKVSFAGAVPFEAMRGFYRSAQLSLVTSLCGEGTSLAALESMACGTPVVATRVAGLEDLPCVLAEPTPEALAQAILEVLEAREDFATSQRAKVLEEFNLPRWQAAWQELVLQE